MPEATGPIKIFIIYAREDGDALVEFKKSLIPLERRGEVAVWYDGEIIAGQEWERAIKKNLQSADIIVLFLSSDFFNSDYIEKKELKDALIRHGNGDAIVTPVIVRHCLWQEHPEIERLQVLPNNANPVFSKKHWDGPDEAFTNVAGGIAKVAREILKKRKGEGETEKIAAELREAAEAYDKREYEKAYSVFVKYQDSLLFLGEYQRRLGRMYDLGQFISVDYSKAKYWYEQAIEKGDAMAMYSLGLLFHNGLGIAQDYAKAKYWYEQAIENGEVFSLNNLGLLYANGQGVVQDYSKAVYWYEKAIEKGDTNAMNNLGNLYHNSQGETQDYSKAKYWYERAIEKGSALAIYNLGVLYHNGSGVDQDYLKAKYWYEQAIENGNAMGMNNLGFLFKNGLGVAQDYSKAIYWYEQASEKGNAVAMYNLGILYHNGLGVPTDLNIARVWYQKAADLGDEDAKKQLAKL